MKSAIKKQYGSFDFVYLDNLIAHIPNPIIETDIRTLIGIVNIMRSTERDFLINAMIFSTLSGISMNDVSWEVFRFNVKDRLYNYHGSKIPINIFNDIEYDGLYYIKIYNSEDPSIFAEYHIV